MVNDPTLDQFAYGGIDTTALTGVTTDGTGLGDVSGSSGDVVGPGAPGIGPVPSGGTGVGFNPNSPLGGLLDAPSEMLALFNATAKTLKDLTDVIGRTVGTDFVGIYTALTKGMPQLEKFLAPDGWNLWQWITDHSVGVFYTDMLHYGLNVDVDKFDKNASDGVKAVDTMLGFTAFIQFAVAAIEMYGKPIFGSRWGHALKDTIAKIPEEMGLSWALGLQIDEAFKTAVGRSIEEGINQQKRPNRLDWPQLRALARQHLLTPDQFTLYLSKLGFPDEDIERISKMSTAMLPVGDLQQMYLHGKMTSDQIATYIHSLGFNDEDGSRLQSLYIDNAETASGALYRQLARGMFESNLITADMYRSILEHVHFPEREIADDIAAVDLMHKYGKLNAAVSVIKQRYQHHDVNADTATTELRLLNYSDDAITHMLQAWDETPLIRQHRLTQAKVLSYLASGILSAQDASLRLTALGLDPRDVSLMVKYPKATNGVTQHKLSPSIVTQAYLDGAILEDQLPALYAKVGVPADDVSYYVQIAQFKFSRLKRKPGATVTLNKGEILKCFKLGLLTQESCMERLNQMGYDDSDAILLLEIENKDVLVVGGPSTDMTLAEAESYLASLGFDIYGPPNATVNRAEQVISAAGYSAVPPPGFQNNGNLIVSGQPPGPPPPPPPGV